MWRIPLEAAAAAASDFSHLLTDLELARASRFRRDEDRMRFQLGRAATRCILANYLELPPTKIRIEQHPAGKPSLSAATFALDRRIQFNLSHSGRWIVAAFARSFPVGIDVEAVTAERATEDLIAYFMSDNERRMLQRLPKHQHTAAFFKCWTSKEAFVKGVGVGLSMPLKAIEVSLDPDQPAQLISAPAEFRADQWRLHTLVVSETYAATLAVEDPLAEVVEITVAGWRDIHH